MFMLDHLGGEHGPSREQLTEHASRTGHQTISSDAEYDDLRGAAQW